ncbi:hypothetical protein Godav_002974 [Gossypium davidsonii]|uniref:Uncharacterized protein n=3 Tax=Gossypium TaxID=3633 RepID=A0A7J8SXV5_GOSDV|nr:hypothetical protein [Gossypium davidsonii]MBA0666652.1 hypothetical protein [Gossypium klotzschianum]
MRPSGYGLRRHNKRRTNGMTKPSSYSTVIMGICLIYSMSKWISTYSELWPSIRILPIVVLLLRR